MTRLIIAALIAIFSSGCVSQSALDQAINEKIAANNIAFVQPMMAQQNLRIEALAGETDQNRDAISKSSGRVTQHREALVDLYKTQQRQATTALKTLNPEPVAAPIEIFSAPVLAPEVVPNVAQVSASENK